MKNKLTALIAVGGLVSALVGSNAVAGPLAPIVHKANHLRMSAWDLNQYAQQIDAEIRHQLAHNINPVHLRIKARQVRQQATRLAHRSNHVAKHAFNHGYHRPNHSHQRHW